MIYSVYSVKRLEKENLRLHQKVRRLNRIIWELDSSFEARFFGAIETVTKEYASLLKPYPVVIEEKIGEYKNEYEISTAQIVCIVADELTKHIVLIKPMAPRGNGRRKKQIVDYEGKWEELETKLPAAFALLCKVNKSTYVNVAFYDLDRDNLKCQLDLPGKGKPAKTIKLNRSYVKHFKEKKENFNQLRSMEKRLVDFF